MTTANNHPSDCPCALCNALKEQAKGAKTTKDNRVSFNIHLTREERQELKDLAKAAGTSPKALAESAVRSLLSCSGN
ncbi:MAG: hypothetical protein KC800_30555 [Candidatus Eremiobacteraeota bacterium]|nr:hypothetical protein [Candidatus Eremiobacteraeota bacterium]